MGSKYKHLQIDSLIQFCSIFSSILRPCMIVTIYINVRMTFTGQSCEKIPRFIKPYQFGKSYFIIGTRKLLLKLEIIVHFRYKSKKMA